MIKVVYPQNITLKHWAACLVYDFKSDNLPLLTNENEFENWGKTVAGSGTFARAGIPSPSIFKTGTIDQNWVKWAKIVYTIMSDEYNREISPQTN
jgi:hypothetical protein